MKTLMSLIMVLLLNGLSTASAQPGHVTQHTTEPPTQIASAPGHVTTSSIVRVGEVQVA